MIVSYSSLLDDWAIMVTSIESRIQFQWNRFTPHHSTGVKLYERHGNEIRDSNTSKRRIMGIMMIMLITVITGLVTFNVTYSMLDSVSLNETGQGTSGSMNWRY